MCRKILQEQHRNPSKFSLNLVILILNKHVPPPHVHPHTGRKKNREFYVLTLYSYNYYLVELEYKNVPNINYCYRQRIPSNEKNYSTLFSKLSYSLSI